MSIGNVVDEVVDVLGVAGSITTTISLAAVSLLIAFLLARNWLKGQQAGVEKAIAGKDDAALARLLGGTSVPLDGLSPEQKLKLATEELRTRSRQRMLGYTLIFFSFLAILGFALALGLARGAPAPNSPARQNLVTIDSLQALDILRFIPASDRTRACIKLMSREDCNRAAAVLSALEYQPLAPSQQKVMARALDQGGVTAVQLRELAACGGSYHFRVADDRLTCEDGTPIPFLRANKDTGPLVSVDAVVFHSTATPDNSFRYVSNILANGRPDLEGPLAHLLISRTGAMVQFVAFNRIVSHAGMTEPWQGMRIQNSNSVGIQMINRGPESNEAYTAAQISAAEGVIKALAAAYHLRAVVGHYEIAPGRKTDPGLLFPLSDMRKAAGL